MTDMLTLDDFDGWWRAFGDTYADRRNPGAREGLGCVYTNSDGDHCVAGQFLADHGLLTPDDTTEWPADVWLPKAWRHALKLAGTSPNTRVIETIVLGFELPLEDELVDRLTDLQDYADQGQTWGDALDIALAREAEKEDDA